MSEVAYLAKEDDVNAFSIYISISPQEVELLDLCDFFAANVDNATNQMISSPSE